ncbi:hypothetical protein HDZ31DRAFT_59787 [Schizophyllum fasciatum]
MAADTGRPSIGSPRPSLDGVNAPVAKSPPLPASSAPPHYILVSHAGVLAHAPITYHYADDPALALLPETPEEHVVLLNWCAAPSSSATTTASPTPVPHTTTNTTPLTSPSASTPSARIAHSESTINPDHLVEERVTAQSLSPMLAVTGVRAEDVQSHRMYVIETTEGTACPPPQEASPEALVASFKQRNAALQRVLDYPST